MERNNMDNNKSLIPSKKNFFKKFLNKIKSFFENKKLVKNVEMQEKVEANEYKVERVDRKRDFLDSIKVEENSEIYYLKIKLESGEVKAIDLTDEQIDELQKIYDKEIEEKKNKINKLKNIA